MLGLGASCNNDEGYAKGERYRERLHSGGLYDSVTNPVGRIGQESGYFGDFMVGTDKNYFQGGIAHGSGVSSIEQGALKVVPTLSYGGVVIYVSAVIGVQYKLTFVYDPNGSRNSVGRVTVGSSTSDLDAFADTGDIADDQEGETQTLTYTSTVANPVIKFTGKQSGIGKKTYFDDISLKEA